MDIKIPACAAEIIDKLNKHGYEAFIVGGCVRDMLLGREPGDWDITTSALPWQVKKVFRRTVDTGIKHGTVTVLMGKAGYEVTTYRIDGEYLDGRHPDSVSFTPDLREDLKRRDFTINAMAYNSREGIVDEFGGREDLKAGIIRCVGNAQDRFLEDALRILRAIRFSAQLGFAVEEKTYGAIRAIAPNLVHVSKERIQAELTKLLISGHPERMALIWEAGISPYVSPAFSGLWEEKKALPSVPASVPAVKHMRWAAFLRLASPEDAVKVLKELKMDNDTIYRVKTLVTWASFLLEQDKAPIRRVMSRMEPELFDDLITLKMCLAERDSLTVSEKRPKVSEESLKLMEAGTKVPERKLQNGEERMETFGTLAHIRVLAEEIRRDRECVTLKDLAVDGRDIIEAGVRPGREVGACLARLLDLVLEKPSRNTREYLLRHLK